MNVIDFSERYWGHDFTISTVSGNTIRGHFWHEGGPQVGDFMILPNEGRTTRYRITQLRNAIDPGDMWSYEAEFAPRTEVSP